MLEFAILSLPVLVYVLVAGSKGQPPERTLDVVGLRAGTVAGYGLALVVTALLGALTWAVLQFVPPQALGAQGITPLTIGVVAVLMTVLRAAGEELLFRGLIAGLLFRGMGFALGNALQAVAFLLPHLGLLGVDLRLWPMVLVQFVAGWTLGWLRHRTGSVGPCVLAHAVSNVASAVLLAP